MPTSHPLYQVDSFADRPFTGNPAAVCLLDAAADPAWMQQVGREMNLSETAFLFPEGDGFNLRWFTPATEVDLCGHATLAAAHVLWESGRLAPDATARFHTKSGLLTATADDGWIELDFPSLPPAACDAPAGLLAALGAKAVWLGRSRFDVLVELATAAAVRALAPAIAALRGVDARGVIVTAKSDVPGYDFVSRFFAPRAGVDEDPVTGSAHSVLTPFWSQRLDKPEMTGFQASARGGVVRVRMAGDRVRIAGRAITVLEGTLRT